MTVCALAIKHGVVPPTINLSVPDPDCDLDYVPNTARELEVKRHHQQFVRFGGHNASTSQAKEIYGLNR